MPFAVGEAVTLLSNYTGAGPGTEAQVNGGGFMIWAYDGTFAGATLTLEFLSPDGTNWISSGLTATAEGAQPCYVANGTRARITMSGAVAAMYSKLVSAGISG
jgi:hypothetical protein